MTKEHFRFNKSNKYIFLLLLSIMCIGSPAYAYGGPGVAIAGIVVFITVVITFFASFFLTLLRYLKKSFKYFKNLTSKKSKPKDIKQNKRD